MTRHILPQLPVSRSPHRRRQALGALVLTLALASYGTAGHAGPSTDAALATGEILDPIATLGEDDETYALYLPEGYTAGSELRWPILFVLDPRSQGRQAAERFKPAAERFGYILVSSNSTRSDLADGTPDPNPGAMVALFRDAMTRFAADEKRVYLTGFSGTARYAWSVGFGLPGKIAGVIGCGGALPGPFEPWRDVTFAYFGTAGETDFNHHEMQLLDRDLDATDVAHRFTYFPGGHEWATPEVLVEALGWMEVQAMGAGTKQRQDEQLARLYAEEAAAARSLEAESPFVALRRWQQLARDFDGLHDTQEAQQAATRLASESSVQQMGKAVLEAAEREASYRQHLDNVLNQVIGSSPIPPLRSVLRRLRIPQLLERSQLDSLAGISAQRQLSIAFVNTVFYRPRILMQTQDARRAILMLEIAQAVKPDHWRPEISLAVAYAGSGKRAKALAALEQAVDAGYANLDFIEQADELEPLRSEPAYRALVDRLRDDS
ncbi:MAG: hypothetical protein AAF560_06750 [Acidobacteriota bacterium]